MDNKTLLILGLLGVGLIAISKSIKSTSDRLGEIGKDDIEDLPESERDEINQHLRTGPIATISLAQADSYARMLRTAMSGIGTDENAIYRVIKSLKNQSDWLMIARSFGVVNGLTLTGYLYDDLSLSEQKIVSELLSNIQVKFDIQ